MQNASFWKWREVSIQAFLPDAWARFIHARGANITLAARNLRTWTRYGLDPELSNSGQDNFTSADFLTQPPVRCYFDALQSHLLMRQDNTTMRLSMCARLPRLASAALVMATLAACETGRWPSKRPTWRFPAT